MCPEDISLAECGIVGVVVASRFLESLRRAQVPLHDRALVSVQHQVTVQPEVGSRAGICFAGRPVSAGPRA